MPLSGISTTGAYIRRIPLNFKGKCSKEDSNLHRFPY
jgi:hypothetical protein